VVKEEERWAKEVKEVCERLEAERHTTASDMLAFLLRERHKLPTYKIPYNPTLGPALCRAFFFFLFRRPPRLARANLALSNSIAVGFNKSSGPSVFMTDYRKSNWAPRSTVARAPIHKSLAHDFTGLMARSRLSV
jgi:hypothetical protein